MKYRLVFTVSFLNILYERAWSAFWPALTILAGYAALALLRVTGMFGGAGGGLLFVVFAAGFAWALVRFGGAFRFPSAADVERRSRFRVKCTEKEPKDAFVAVQYRDHWFWVDDRDLVSKRHFAFVMYLFTLADTGERGGQPVLTIPT